MAYVTAPRSKIAALCLCFGVGAFAADPSLTIYNQEFAVVHERVPLKLEAGSNAVQFTGATAHVEPESVILRDASGKRKLTILEQNYRGDVLSQEVLLNLYEGKTVEFMAGIREDGSQRIIRGKIIRSGYAPQSQGRFGLNAGSGQPIIEVEGKLQFFLPGQPIFPDLGDDTILKPSLAWKILSSAAAAFDAELSYVTGGLTWAADYNLIAPASGDSLDMTGLVTIQNQSGKQFDNARIKLMAGDVSKLVPGNPVFRRDGTHLGNVITAAIAGVPAVTERTFDEYHLYSLPTPATLRDRETKQVQFMQANGIPARRLYVYDGMKLEENQSGYSDLRQMPYYGITSNPHVWVMRELKNSESNQLGMPLPQGRLRFYRRGEDGQLEFTGENEIGHTAKDETVRVYTGNAFDISGERKQTKYEANNTFPHGSTDESFEIAVRNHKKESATVHVVEHLYRWQNWSITTESGPHTQKDSRTIEYEIALQPDESKVVTYTVHYAW